MSRWPSGLKLLVPPTDLNIELCDELVLRFEGRVAGPKGHADIKIVMILALSTAMNFLFQLYKTEKCYFAICIYMFSFMVWKINSHHLVFVNINNKIF